MSVLMSLVLAALLFSPGDVVPEQTIASEGTDAFFCVGPVPDAVFETMKGKSFRADCVTPRDSLRYVTCLHRDAAGRAIVGEMVVGRRIAEKVVTIFKELFEAAYPIERMRLVDYWDADDERSMTANNSSSFNFRFISHTTTVSKHGLGLAVDINPLYNPYVKTLSDGTRVVEPACAVPYTDRTLVTPYTIREDDLCVRLFKKHGFEWGGDWISCKDYQHFEL